MAYQFKSLKQILDIFIWGEPLWATEISLKLWKSTTIVHKYLKELTKEWKLKKIWDWPRSKYVLSNPKLIDEKLVYPKDEVIDLSFVDKKLLDEVFLKFSADWKLLRWFEWIKIWCNERSLNVEDKIHSYIDIYKHIQSLQNKCWLIDAKNAFWKDFTEVYLDNIYYADQYKWMDFWRWKLAEITFYWKQSQNKSLILQSIEDIIYKLECLIRMQRYDSIAIVPWSIERKNQLLALLKLKLKN